LSLLNAILELLESRSRLKLRLIDHEEVAWTAFREVRLRQDVLHARYRAHLSFVVNVLQLMDVVWLIDDPVTSFKVDKPILVK
jgi:hypothetical protein